MSTSSGPDGQADPRAPCPLLLKERASEPWYHDAWALNVMEPYRLLANGLSFPTQAYLKIKAATSNPGYVKQGDTIFSDFMPIMEGRFSGPPGWFANFLWLYRHHRDAPSATHRPDHQPRCGQTCISSRALKGAEQGNTLDFAGGADCGMGSDQQHDKVLLLLGIGAEQLLGDLRRTGG